LLNVGDIIDNRTLCDLFGVANMGGMRVNRARSTILLISNNTDATYTNAWHDDVLHFVGMGSVGPQKLDRQNRTLAESKRRGWEVHLFEVFEKGRYVYAGQVELAGEPYRSDQPDASGAERYVWIFPVTKKATQAVQGRPIAAAVDSSESGLADHLPYGAYATIGGGLNDHQLKLVDEALDRLKDAGVAVFDQRDVDLQRYEVARERWWKAVLDQVRFKLKEMIAKRKRRAKAENRGFGFTDSELALNSASTELELRQVFTILESDDPAELEQLFEDARQGVPMPEVPKSIEHLFETESTNPSDVRVRPVKPIDRSRFKDFK
jgi:hypothetical protein